MSGDAISGELIDYLNNELPAGRRAEIEELLKQNPDRARELEEYRRAQQAFRQLRVATVSDDFSRKVRERIARKVEELRARGSTRFRTGRERVEAAREGLSTEEIKRRGKKAVTLYLLALLIAAPLFAAGALITVWYFSEQARLRELSAQQIKDRLEKRHIDARREARAAAISPKVGEDGTLQGMDFLGEGEVHLVMNSGRDRSERCVFVYTAAQWEAYLAELEKRRGMRNYDLQLAAAESAVAVRSRNGRLYLPPSIYSDFLKNPAELSVLRFSDRAEIWDPGELEDYLSVNVRMRGRKAPSAESAAPGD
jgi:anti-sigma factor RsiW/DNA-binding transcriptional regulator/RsmH inhibitor MraZ